MGEQGSEQQEPKREMSDAERAVRVQAVMADMVVNELKQLRNSVDAQTRELRTTKETLTRLVNVIRQGNNRRP